MAVMVIPSNSAYATESGPPVTSVQSNTLKKFTDKISGASKIYCDYLDKLSPTGDFQKIYGMRVLINSLRNLLMTPLGSYPFDPSYGSLLYKKVFEIADSITEQEIIFEVTDRIKQVDDRIVIKDVNVSFFTDGKGYRVSVTIQKDRNLATTQIDFTEKEVGFALEEG